MKIILGTITENNGDGSMSTNYAASTELANRLETYLEENDPYWEGPTEMAGRIVIEISDNGEIKIDGNKLPTTIQEYLNKHHNGEWD